MIDFYFWTTPNGYKPLLFLEEAGVPHTIKPVNISKGEQFEPEFLEISPNNRIPAIVDRDPAEGEKPLAIFESGAILQYLAEKTGKFLPTDIPGRAEVMQWLFWQMANLGPMAGQLSHFVNYAPEPVPYAHDRYEKEYDRLLCVMDTRLEDGECLAGDYSIADIASFPWVMSYKRLGADLDKFANLRRWFDAIKARPAVQRGAALGSDWHKGDLTDEEARKVLFGQTAESIAAAAKARK